MRLNGWKKLLGISLLGVSIAGCEGFKDADDSDSFAGPAGAGGATASGPDATGGAGFQARIVNKAPTTTAQFVNSDFTLANETVVVNVDAVGTDPAFALLAGEKGIALQTTSAPTGGNLIDFALQGRSNDQFIIRAMVVRGGEGLIPSNPLTNIVLNYDIAADSQADGTSRLIVKGVVTDLASQGAATAVAPVGGTVDSAAIGGADAALATVIKATQATSATFVATYGASFFENVPGQFPILLHKGTRAPVLVQTTLALPRSGNTLIQTTAIRNLAGLFAPLVGQVPQPLQLTGFADVIGIGGAGHRSLDLLAAGPMFIPFPGSSSGVPALQASQVSLPVSFGAGVAPYVSFVGRDQDPVSYTLWDSLAAVIVQRSDNNFAIVAQLSSTTSVAVVDDPATQGPVENQIAWLRNMAIGWQNDAASSADQALRILRDNTASIRGLSPTFPLVASIRGVNTLRDVATIRGRLKGVPEGTVVAIGEVNPTSLVFFDPGSQSPTQTALNPPDASAFRPTFVSPQDLSGVFTTPVGGGLFALSPVGPFFHRQFPLSQPVIRTTVRPGADGQFAASVPVGNLNEFFFPGTSTARLIDIRSSTFTAVAHMPGGATKSLGTFTVNVGQGVHDMGEIDLTATSGVGTVEFEIVDDSAGGQLIPGVINVQLATLIATPTAAVPFDMGFPTGLEPESLDTSVAGNIVMSASGRGTFSLKAGLYNFIANSGFEYEADFFENTNIVTGTASQNPKLTFHLTRAAPTPGLVSGDFHVHSGQSFDSSFVAVDRVRSFVATGVEVLGQSEHDRVGNLDAAYGVVAAERPDLAQRLKLMKGTESTTDLGWIGTNPAALQDIGHWNAFPLNESNNIRKHGGIDDEFRPPAILFAQLRLQDGNPTNDLIIMAHPNTGLASNLLDGADGFLTAMKSADPAAFGSPFGTSGIPAAGVSALVSGAGATSVTVGAIIAGTAGVGASTPGFDAYELMITGQEVLRYIQNRSDWFSLLHRGVVKTSIANSDSHRPDDRFSTLLAQAGHPVFGKMDQTHVGVPRTYMLIDETVDQISDADVVGALKPSFPAPFPAGGTSLAPVTPTAQSGMKAFGTTGPIFTQVNLRTATLTADAIGKFVDVAGTATAAVEVAVEGPSWIMEHVTEIRLVQGQDATGAFALPTPTAGTITTTTNASGGVKKTATFTVTVSGLTNDTWLVVEAGQPLAGLQTDAAGGSANLPAATSLYGQIYPRQYVLSWTNPIFLDVNGNGAFEAAGRQ